MITRTFIFIIGTILLCNIGMSEKRSASDLDMYKLANIEALAGDDGTSEGSAASTGPVSVDECGHKIDGYSDPITCLTTVVRCSGKDKISCSQRKCPDHSK